MMAWLFCCPVFIHAQISYHIGIENGISTDNLTTIIRDTKGYMWFGSYNGLHQHQGARIRIYNKVGRDSLSLSGSEMDALYNDHRGDIWVGTTAGLDRLTPSTGLTRHYSLKTTRTRPSHLGYIYSIFEDREHYIWVSSDEALFRVDPASGSYTSFYAGEGSHHVPGTSTGYRQGLGDERGFWMSTSGGLAFYEYSTHSFQHRYNSRLPVFALDQGTNGSAASDICTDDQGNIYFIAGGDKLVRYHLKTGHFVTYPFVHPPGSWYCCYSLARDFKGNLWIGFRHGGILIFNIADGSFTPVRKEMHNKLLQSNYVNELCEDYEHHMWVTTDDGIDVIDYYQQGIQQIQLSEAPDFRKLQYASAIMSDDKAGHLFIPFMNGSLFVYDYHKDSISEHRLSQVPAEKITYLLPSGDGSAEIFNRYGITRVAHPLQVPALKKAQTRQTAGEQPHHFVIWSYAAKGVRYIKYANLTLDRIAADGTVQHLSNYGYMKQACVSADSNYLYFVNDESDLVRQDILTGAMIKYDLQPLLATAGFAFSNTRDLTDDGAGNVWMTAQNGLLRYNISRHKLEAYTTSRGLVHNFTYSLLTDDHGVVWVCSFGGIDWYDKASNTFHNALKYRDGTYMDAFGSSVKTTDGTLYFLSGNKLTRIRPAAYLQSAFKRSHLLINEVLVNGIQLSGTDDPALQHLSRNENRILIRYGLLDYSSQQGNRRLQYRLKGSDDEWIEDGRTEVAYNGLPPGRYVFQVRALTPNGQPVQSAVPIVFRIHPAIWETIWARLLFLALTGTGIFLLVRRRIKAIQRKAFLKQQMMELESRALRSQMNPHFIFNSLNAIQELVIREDSNGAYQYLSKFSRLLRMVLLHSEHSLIPLSDELEMYGLYLSLEKLRFNHSFQYRILIDDEVDQEELMIPPLLLQPYLENAIWHGLMHRKGEKVLEISFVEKEETIVCTITDNGIGRAAAAEIRKGTLRTKGDTSRGMSLTHSRIALLNGDKANGSGVVIHDLTDEHGQPSGTQVVVTLAIKVPAQDSKQQDIL